MLNGISSLNHPFWIPTRLILIVFFLLVIAAQELTRGLGITSGLVARFKYEESGLAVPYLTPAVATVPNSINPSMPFSHFQPWNVFDTLISVGRSRYIEVATQMETVKYTMANTTDSEFLKKLTDPNNKEFTKLFEQTKYLYNKVNGSDLSID